MTPYRVLVVEDDPMFAEYVRSILEEQCGVGKFHCQLAKTLTQAAGYLASSVGTYDLCLLDLKINGDCGPSTLRYMLNVRDDIPFVVMTGSGSDEVEQECMDMGAQDFIRKESIKGDRESILKLVKDLEKSIRRHNARRVAKALMAPVKAMVADAMSKPPHQQESVKASDTTVIERK